MIAVRIMKHIANISPAAATDEPAVPLAHRASAAPAAPPAPPVPPIPPVTESLINAALDDGRDSLSGRPARKDGWTPERIRTFLHALAASGCVTESAEAAGVTRQAAYALRASTKGRAFALAWDGAVRMSRGRLATDLLSRALNGNVETVWRDGVVVEQRHHHDNGLGLALLARLDRLAAHATTSDAARYVADEFDQFVEIAAAGGEGAAAFVAARGKLGYRAHEEAQVLERAENYIATGDGLPEGRKSGESSTDEFIRSLYEAACEPDDEYEVEDQDEDEAGDGDGDEPRCDAWDEDASGPECEDEDDVIEDYRPDMTLEEFQEAVLAGPLGQFDDDDEDEDEVVEIPDGFDIEAHAAWLARRLEAALNGDAGPGR